MLLLYYIWSVLYDFLLFFSYYFESLFFFKNNNIISINRLSVFKKKLLIWFYNPIIHKKLFFIYRDLDLIFNERFYSNTIAHSFFKKKFSYSNKNIFKINFDVNHDLELISIYFIKINLRLLQKNFYWQNISFQNKNSLLNYFNSNKTNVSINHATINGFIKYISYSNYHELNSEFNLKKLSYKNKYFYKIRFFLKKNVSTYITKNFYKNSIFSFDTIFLNTNKNLFLVKNKPTDVTRFVSEKSLLTFLFLRKSKIFNKGRYSRNRQLYRTGVYWCLWLNIINVYGLYYYFYRFLFNFGYMYIPFIVFILSIFFSRLFKYRLYNPTILIKEFSYFLVIFHVFCIQILKNFILKSKELGLTALKFFLKSLKRLYTFLIS